MKFDKIIGDESQFTLEHRILNTVLAFSILLSFWTAVVNYLLGRGIWAVLACAVSGAILLSLHHLSVAKKQYQTSVMLVLLLSIFIIIPLTWLFNGGTFGGNPLYVAVFSSLGAAALTGRNRYIAVFSLIIMAVVIIMLEYEYPWAFAGRANGIDRYIDISIALATTAIANTILYGAILGQYKQEHDKARRYLSQIEKQKVEGEIARLDRLNIIGEMAASIGHEVRNPLTTVRGFLQLFQRKEEYDQHKEHFDLMIVELDRANLIITEFLSLAKNRAINLQPRNLNHLIEELYPLLQASALRESKEIEVVLDNLPLIVIDENEIKQCLLNLVQNALEAMTAGGVVTIATAVAGDRVVMSVRDTGGGIPPEVFGKIGTPFVTTKEKGTGLGLSVCYRIADRHDARIEIETSSNGTTFVIEFKSLPPV
ncbi:MAG: ATP-binding protein [Negativicutes bacterium]|nr:ATP-binding protein [Negativicutes bacterium]